MAASGCGSRIEVHFFSVMAGHSRSKNGVASARLCPAIHVFLAYAAKTWMPGTADKFTQSA
jgi:putative Ca2+/H+ antiporter (TMEM165/GDT1 family)